MLRFSVHKKISECVFTVALGSKIMFRDVMFCLKLFLTILQTLIYFKGPVTVVSGKKQRLTFIECPNDVNYMIDIAKVADLVLLLIDASFGFEMEIFEFLNIAQVCGLE